jgi:hypothetical protein
MVTGDVMEAYRQKNKSIDIKDYQGKRVLLECRQEMTSEMVRTHPDAIWRKELRKVCGIKEVELTKLYSYLHL